MKPARFDYERPQTLSLALSLIADDGIAARIIAGGQSLGPMLNMRLVQPELIIDVTAIKEMKRVELTADVLTFGACITHSDIEDGRIPDVTRGAMRAIAGGVAYRAVRNRGTIGGSLCHADPASDWVSTLAALGAEVVARGKSGARVMSVERYVTGALENALLPGELLEAVRVPPLSPAARWGYYKVCRKTGEFAHAIGAFVMDPAHAMCRVAIGGADTKPIVVADARALFGGSAAPRDASTFDLHAVDSLLIKEGVTDSIERQIRVSALRRAVARAFDA